jgi:hypothetical protein
LATLVPFAFYLCFGLELVIRPNTTRF